MSDQISRAEGSEWEELKSAGPRRVPKNPRQEGDKTRLPNRSMAARQVASSPSQEGETSRGVQPLRGRSLSHRP